MATQTPREQRNVLFQIEAQDSASPFVLLPTAPAGDVDMDDVHQFRELFANCDFDDAISLYVDTVRRAMELMSSEQRAEFVKFAQPE